METFNDARELEPQTIFNNYKEACDYLAQAEEIRVDVEKYGSLEEARISKSVMDSIDWLEVEEQSLEIDEALFGADVCIPLQGGSYGAARGYYVSMIALDKEVDGKYEDFAVTPPAGHAKLKYTPAHFSSVHVVYVPDPQVHGKDARPFILNKDIWQQQFNAYKSLSNNAPDIEADIIKMSAAEGLSTYIEWGDVSKLADICEANANMKLKVALPDIDS